jgi:outer membrane protein assembly factor BamC
MSRLSALNYVVASAVLVAGIVGCSATSDLLESKRIEYKSAGKLPPLEIPPELTAPNAEDRYAVPDAKGQGGVATYSAYNRERTGAVQAGNSGLLPNPDNIRIERAGAQRWLVVKAAPEEVWPVVKEFWQGTGFIIKKEIPEAGVMETDWAEDRAKIPQDVLRKAIGYVFDDLYSTAERDKFRTRIERGSERGTCEIYISHRGMKEVVVTEGRKDTTRWEPRPSDPELEAEMLRRLMVHFGVDQARAQAQTATKEAERAKLSKATDGTSQLALDDAFDRAWRRVGLALDRVGFTVEDRDRSKGLYYVRYVDPRTDNKKEEDGFLSKLAFWRENGGAKPEQYRIAVTEAGATTQVEVLDKAGNASRSEAAHKILSLLYDQLK